MSDTEILLLSNVLDALDRLFDRKTTVVDVHALLFATSCAMNHSRFYDELRRAAENLAPLRARAHDSGRDEALAVTNSLRILLAANTT